MGKKQGDQNIEKIAQILETAAQTVAGPKYIHFKAQFENPAYLHQTTFKTLKYLQQTMLKLLIS